MHKRSLGRARWILLAAPGLLAAPSSSARAQAAIIRGTVLDAGTSSPVGNVTLVGTLDGRVAARTVARSDGTFELGPLPPGRCLLTATRIGFDPLTIGPVVLTAGDTVALTFRLVARAVVINPEIVSASRRQEKMLDAPASVSVIDRAEVAHVPALTPAEFLAGLPGVDVVTSGLTQRNVVTRGFNNAGSGQLLVLTDNRFAAVPSLRINAYNFIPLTNEDIDHIEVVRGPGAALYGPDATAGVLHLITRSPFDSPGTALGIAGGTRSLFQLTGRHAGVVASRIGWRVSAQYLRATDFGYVDPGEQANRDNALLLGADPDTLRAGKRDSLIERVGGEARVDLRAGDRTTLVWNAGFNTALNNVDITGLGAVQVHGWRYQYAQLRLIQPRLFAQVFFNGSDAGDTYRLLSGQPVVDHSRMLVAQLQHVVQPGDRETLTWGLDAQRTDPRTSGTIYGQYEGDDMTDQVGAYLHSETHLKGTDLVAALRLDHHSRVPGAVLSPRGALVLRPAAGHTVRLTYNRAFSPPTSNDLFLDYFVDWVRDPATQTTIPIAIRAMGVPASGLTFRRDCGPLLGGLCMRSPFTPLSLGGPGSYIPADATLLWGALLDTLKNHGTDLTGIPAPTAAQVATVLGRFDTGTGTAQTITPGDVSDLAPLGHKITNTIEIGYKGLVANRLLAAVDVYHSWYHGFTREYVATPNIFFDSPSLRTYLAQFIPSAQADLVAGVVAQVPVGTISPQEAFDPTAILVTFRNFGSVRLWGVDASVAFQATSHLTATGAYSLVSDNLFHDVSGIGDVALNAPRSKASLNVRYADDRVGVSGFVGTRYVGGFPVLSGIYSGTVRPYATVDAGLSYRLPWSRATMLSLTGWNLIQATTDAFSAAWHIRSRHREFVRVPDLGAVVLARVQLAF